MPPSPPIPIGRGPTSYLNHQSQSTAFNAAAPQAPQNTPVGNGGVLSAASFASAAGWNAVAGPYPSPAAGSNSGSGMSLNSGNMAAGGFDLLAEAAKRAEFSIMVDDMGGLGFGNTSSNNGARA
ncbi:hypothetical protein SAICODRAFT_7825 [Saitoella complicata NRRL Y-17804]|nr:uncharacterized protein SAICODRAFT_7825 [Saitoella complicata NRRL Y-17804]ODQ52794.1 hypothetical protein SAICODRAFT_7825 [Saitoella complicata NRRL Y-17804]